MKFAVFSDFDGTISKRDIGYSIFHHFSGGKNDALLPDWKSGKMTSREVLLAEAEMVTATPEEIFEYIDRFEIDDYFTGFKAVCREYRFPLTVLSDGLDIYIKRLFDKYNLSDLKFYANHAELVNNSIEIQFNHTNQQCQSCGICKGEVIRDFRISQDDELQIIFIGDGYSDVCATKEADILFAKKDLKKYCDANKISYNSYNNFNDILIILKQLDIIS